MTFDRTKFLNQFKEELQEHIQNVNEVLLKLEKEPQNLELLDIIMREVHTIKGSAMIMGYEDIKEIAHRMETGFEKALHKKVNVSDIDFNLFFNALDMIEILFEDEETRKSQGLETEHVKATCSALDEAFSTKTEEKQQPKSTKKEKQKKKDKEPKSDTKPEPEPELETNKEKKKTDDVCMVPHTHLSLGTDNSIKVDVDKLDKLMNFSGELIISKIRLRELIETLNDLEHIDIPENTKNALKELRVMEGNVDFLTSNVNDEVMNLRMLPLSFLFNTFPRAMRDLAKNKGKEVEFEIKGADTRLDKSIIIEMKDPLMHLLRNSIDHGLESPDDREKNGKPHIGQVTLNAYQKGSSVIIEVSDDGKGIDIEAIKAKALEQEIVSKEKLETLTKDQIFKIMFTPSFSTAKTITDTSGRGVGLDVVKDKITQLKGEIEVVSKSNQGTKFIIKLPLTLAITKCLLIDVGNEIFAIPIDVIAETVRIPPDGIKVVENNEVVSIQGKIIPLVRLDHIFHLSTKGLTEKRFFSVVIVRSALGEVALLVDKLLGRQEIISKTLGYPLTEVRHINNGTILGDGRVILILNIPSIVNMIEEETSAVVTSTSIETSSSSSSKRRKTILLAEDVLSTAMIEKNILEMAGFSVVLARDGAEALEIAAQETFDLVITDVLMPKVNGFELIQKLKKDKKYKNIPFIVVTSRKSDDDKRRGLEVGADAYILKSDFTSDYLLECIGRLI